MAAALLPAYLVVGSDKLKRETAMTRLKGRLDEGLAAFNLDERAAAADLDPTDIAISLNTLPVGEGFRLVLIHEANRLPKPVAETIISYLANPNPGCVLCLDAETLAKNTRLYKAVAKVGARSVIDCTPPKGYQLPQYVAKHAAAMGLAIDTAAARELVSRVGESTVLLDRQLATLGELCAGGRIRMADVETYVARTAEVNPWEFVDRVSEGDLSRALELYRHMKKPGHVGLTTFLTQQVRNLMCAKALAERGKSAQLASQLGRQAWKAKSIQRDAARFTRAQLQECLVQCARCERDLKSGADPETTFFALVFKICRPA